MKRSFEDGEIRGDFALKLRVACEHAASVHNLTNGLLQREVGVSHDTWAKWKRGETIPTDDRLEAILRVFEEEIGLVPESWSKPVAIFKAGLTGADEAATASLSKASVEFRSRDQQPDLLLSQLRGYWLAFYCSMSVRDRQTISRDLVEVSGTHRNGYVACRVTDSHYTYTGFCFTYGGGLVQWLLEKDELLNEVLSYMTTRPERTPPVLLGAMMATTGGVSSLSHLPAAAKVVMLRLGTADTLAAHLGLTPTRAKEVLATRVPRLLVEGEVSPWIRNAISNILTATEVPSALTVSAAQGPSVTERQQTIDATLDELKVDLKG